MGSTTFTNTLSYTYGLPYLDDVEPKRFPTDGGTILTITGVNFGIDLLARYNAMVRRRSSLESVAQLNSWRANQVFLVLNSQLYNCSVVTVSTL